MAVAHLHAVHHAECDDIATLAVFHGSQRVEDLFFGNVRHILDSHEGNEREMGGITEKTNADA